MGLCHKNNVPGLLIKTLFKHESCFLSSIARMARMKVDINNFEALLNIYLSVIFMLISLVGGPLVYQLLLSFT